MGGNTPEKRLARGAAIYLGVQMALSSTTKSATGLIPRQLLFGLNLRQPWSLFKAVELPYDMLAIRGCWKLYRPHHRTYEISIRRETHTDTFRGWLRRFLEVGKLTRKKPQQKLTVGGT